MLSRKLHIRGLSRLMAMMFAAQIIVAGFCMLTAEAHAVPQSLQTHGVGAHCAKYAHAVNQHSQDHSGNCYHCDQPDELSNSTFTSVAPVALVLFDVIHLPTAPLFSSDATGLFSTRTPTGPPRSSSLLYSTTQRIRV